MCYKLTVRFLIFLTLLGCSFRLHAYNVKSITNRDGLVNSSVLSFCEVQNGMMLFGTCDGVCYYDGSRVQTLNSQLRNGIRINGPVVEDIAKGRNDIVWIMTNHGLTGLKRNSEATFYPELAGIRRITSNDDGDLFIVTDDTLYTSVGNTCKLAKVPLKGAKTSSLCDYAVFGQNLYLFNSDGIMRYTLKQDKDKWQVTQALPLVQKQILSVHQDRDTEYVVDKEGTLWDFDLNSGGMSVVTSLQQEIKSRGNVTGVHRFLDLLVVGFQMNGIIGLQGKGDDMKVIDYGFNVGIMNMYADKDEDMLWIGSDGQGVLLVWNAPMTQRAITSSLLHLNKNKPIRSVMLDRKNTLWIGTKGDGLLSIPNFTMENPRYEHFNVQTKANSGLSGNRIFTLTQSQRLDGFFIGSEGGVDFYSQEEQRISHVQTEEPIEHACAICEQGDTLWIATQGVGVYRGVVEVSGQQVRLTAMKRFLLDGGQKASNYFFSMAISSDGRVYLGNRGKGLFVVDDEKLRFVAPSIEKKSVGLNDIFAILPTSKGMWVGTGDGLIFRDNAGKVTFYDSDSGLPNNTIHALAEDGIGNVWATTNVGVVCFLKGGPEFHILKNNLPVLEYCDGAAFAQDNLVALGGTNGVMMFGFDETDNRPYHPFFAEISGISILGRPERLDEYVSTDGERNIVRLNHEQNTFQLTISTYDYVRQDNFSFYYKLSDNGNWIDNGESTQLNFTNMSPGKYTLYVKYKEMLTGMESPVFTHRIVISPPWYQSWWAIAAYFILAAAFFYVAFLRWERRQKHQRYLQKMEEEQDRREEVYEQKMRFMTNLVHELNTPLTLVYGPCERMLNYEGADNTVKRYTRMVMQNMNRLNFLIKEIIDYRRITGGHDELRIRAVAVSEWLDEMVSAFADMAEDNCIIYDKEIERDIVWNVDDRELTRIFSNLISNAFKYTKKGGKIRIKLWTEKQQLKFSVYNTGRGIAEKDYQRIFDYYTVLDNVDESDTVGLTSRNGLGMSICHQAVKRLNGDIRIDSKVNEYADFIVTLPWTDLPEGADPTPLQPYISHTGENVDTEPENSESVGEEVNAIPQKSSIKPRSYKRREEAHQVLVIDDNQDILTLLTDIMQDEYNVLTAQSAEQGLEILKSKMPDLIITDIMMPGISGLELTQTLKQNKHTRHIPLIILSAKRSEGERIEGLESGADAYVSKPFSPSYLMAIASQLLESRAVLREYYNSSASTFAYQDGKLLTSDEREFRNNVNAVLEKNLVNADFTPEDMAGEIGVSLRNLYRKFNDAGLPTPKDYIKKYRVSVAAHRLLTTNLTIQEIIYATGFNTRTLFYQEFRKYYGMTPKEYREQKFIKDDSLD